MRIWLRHCATSPKVPGSISNEALGFLIDLTRAQYGPMVHLASNRNLYQE
jgi:hypothetical protein